MRTKTAKAILFVAFFTTVLLSEVESFLKIGRDLGRNSWPSQDSMPKAAQKHKDSVPSYEVKMQHEPSLTIAARERDEILQRANKRNRISGNLKARYKKEMKL